MKLPFVRFLLVMACPGAMAYAAGDNLTRVEPLPTPSLKWQNLALPPGKPRFPLTDRVWPATSGEATVCLWEDDKLAAISLTIDDNEAQDVPFWLALAQKHDVKLTWFLVTGGIGKKDSGLAGTWELWKQVKAQGHSLQSHTVTHLGGMRSPDWKGIAWEYAESPRTLDEMLPGQRTRALAYPGTGDERQKANSKDVAAGQYAAARGVQGYLNQANKIAYMAVNCCFSINLGDSEKSPWNDITLIINPDSTKPYQKTYYRGWCVLGFHHLDNKPGATTTHTPANVTRLFDWITANRQDLWPAPFLDAALYGQERDTATVKTLRADEQRISLMLTSEMDPKRFDYPLTVKIRLPSRWETVRASQAGGAIPAERITHAGIPFALVKAKPDCGPIDLTPANP